MADDDETGGAPEEGSSPDTQDRDATLAKITEKAQRVDKLIAESRMPDALAAALEDSPTATKDESCKTANWIVVQKVLMLLRDPDGAVADLPRASCDVLMKYLYRGLETGDRRTCEQFLLIHESLTKKAGMGCIVRALADKKHSV